MTLKCFQEKKNLWVPFFRYNKKLGPREKFFVCLPAPEGGVTALKSFISKQSVIYFNSRKNVFISSMPTPLSYSRVKQLQFCLNSEIPNKKCQIFPFCLIFFFLISIYYTISSYAYYLS